jgi:HEPN domain-containing protein
LILEQQPVILDIACFHCQQAVEKYLKIFLIFKKQEFPRTHNLDLLLQNCSNQSKAFELIDLKNLEDFAVRGRYPHDFIIPDPTETEEFYQIVLQVKTLVLKEISQS